MQCILFYSQLITPTSTKVQNVPFIAKTSIHYIFCAKVCKSLQSSPLLELLVVLCMCYLLVIESALLIFSLLLVFVHNCGSEMTQVGDVAVSHGISLHCLPYLD
jgi:hypothetical protein